MKEKEGKENGRNFEKITLAKACDILPLGMERRINLAGKKKESLIRQAAR